MANRLRPAPSAGSGPRALTPAELGRLLAGWNDTARDVPAVTLAELTHPGARVYRTGDLAGGTRRVSWSTWAGSMTR
jgi:hypothetical protein